MDKFDTGLGNANRKEQGMEEKEKKKEKERAKEAGRKAKVSDS